MNIPSLEMKAISQILVELSGSYPVLAIKSKEATMKRSIAVLLLMILTVSLLFPQATQANFEAWP